MIWVFPSFKKSASFGNLLQAACDWLPAVGHERSSRPEVFCKKVFLEILQNSQENTCVRDSVFLWILWNFQEHLFLQNTCFSHERDNSFITFAKFSEKLTFLTPWYTHVSSYQGVNVSFPEKFANVVNEWSRMIYTILAKCVILAFCCKGILSKFRLMPSKFKRIN